MARRRQCLIAGLAVMATGCASASAYAQVLEIGDGGDVTVHARPEVTTLAGSAPVAPATRRGRANGLSNARPVFLTDAADAARLSPDLIEAVAWRESGLRPRVASVTGAIGEMQLMPGTARTLGVDPRDSRQNYAGGATYLAQLLKRYNGDVILALAAYNAGPGAVDRYGGVPPYKETQAYVAAILDRMSHRAEAAEIQASPER